MNNPRSIITVINEMLEFIPLKEEYLIEQLNEFKNGLWNQAPEALLTGYNWIPVQNILNKYIKNVDTDWKLRLLNIFNGINKN
jgi:hypothetical protein